MGRKQVGESCGGRVEPVSGSSAQGQDGVGAQVCGVLHGRPTSPTEGPAAAPFSKEELMEAVARGKKGKSVGKDGVLHELLKVVCDDPPGRAGVLEWFNDILAGGPAPVEWNQVIMVLLPKLGMPVSPSQLSSAMSKLYARLLLGRTSSALSYTGHAQTMGESRIMFLPSSILQLEAEWQNGLWLAARLSIA